MSTTLRYRTALTSLLILVALMGHSLYHALALEHYHHHHHHAAHHGHLHDEQSEPDQGLESVEVIKCELFSLLPLAPQAGLILQRFAFEGVQPQGQLWRSCANHLVPKSRAPPVLSFQNPAC